MERVSMDILGPFITSHNGNKYVVTISDEFTKWTEAIALPNQEASTIAVAFVHNFICRFGTPLQVHTDQGRNFESSLMKQMCDLFCIHKTRTTSYRPQSNGSVERMNRSLTKMLAAYCQSNQKQWDVYLPQVMMAYRATEHSTTAVSPNMMVLGRNVTLPSQAVIGRPDEDEKESDVDKYVADLQENRRRCHRIARENLKKQAKYRKKYYDSKAKSRRLEINQPV